MCNVLLISLDDFSKKFLKIIEEETDRLNEIVTKILTPAKKPSFEYFNLHETLQRILAKRSPR